MSGMVVSVTVQGGSAKPPRALRLAQRMARLGLGDRGLARLSGKSRNTVANARAGKATDTTYGVLEKTLDDFEHETGADGPDDKVATIDLPDGTRITFVATSAAEAVAFVTEYLDGVTKDEPPS